MDPTAAIYSLNSKAQRKVYIMFAVSIVAIVLTCLLVGFVLIKPGQHSQAVIAALAAAWMIGPPFWFFYEYFWLYRVSALPDTFELFKYGQQVAIAVWAGVSVALTALAASDFVKPAGEKFECMQAARAGTAPEVLTCLPKSS